MIAVINIKREIIFIIVIITTSMAIKHRKKSIMFVAKKVVTLIDIQTINNEKQKHFGDKTMNSVEIKPNTIYFKLIMKEIQIIILMMSIKKQII